MHMAYNAAYLPFYKAHITEANYTHFMDGANLCSECGKWFVFSAIQNYIHCKCEVNVSCMAY